MSPHQEVSPDLPCGRELLALVEQVTEGTAPAEPEHQASCPHCQEALVRLGAAFDAMEDLASRPVTPPRGLSARILRQLRQERHDVVIATSAGGRDTVSAAIVSQVARRAALAVDAVAQASVVSETTPDGGLGLDVHVVARLGPPLPVLAERLRAEIVAHVRSLCGARVTRIDVTVDDVV